MPIAGCVVCPRKCKQTYANTVVWQEFEQIVETNNPEKFLETQDIDNINYKMKGERAMIVDGKMLSEISSYRLISISMAINVRWSKLKTTLLHTASLQAS